MTAQDAKRPAPDFSGNGPLGIDSLPTFDTSIHSDKRGQTQPNSLGVAVSNFKPFVLEWLGRGFAVFPLKPKSKVPLGALVPSGFKDATRAPEKVGEWWTKHPNANIGIATGAGCFVVDLDGPDAERWFINACGRHGDCPPTLSARTSRGWHLFFRSDAEIPCSTGMLAPGVDIKGAGGYIVAAPSIHPTGAVYTIVRDLPLALAPRWLVDLAVPDPVPERAPMPPLVLRGEDAQLRALAGIIRIVATASKGERNRIAFWAACRLGEMVRDGLISAGEAEDILIQTAARAGLPAREARLTAVSGIKRRGQR
jgi:Bifunctional DNA primase/polymerase, N-terminal